MGLPTKTARKKIFKIMTTCFWGISLIEDHILLRLSACCLHSNVSILTRFILLGAIMRTHRLMLTLGLGTNVPIRLARNSHKMRIQSSIGLIGYLTGFHLLLIYKIGYCVCMVESEHRLKLLLIFKILKDHLK
jgi:hypothetical protein